MGCGVAIDDGLDVGDGAPSLGPLRLDETPLHRLKRPVAVGRRQALQPLQRHHVGGRVVALADDAERLARRRPRLGQAEPRIRPERQLGRLAVVAVAHRPAFGARRLHHQVQAAHDVVGDFLALGFVRFDGVDGADIEGSGHDHVLALG